MLIKKQTGIEIPSSEITPEHIYLVARQFMKGAAALAGGALLASCAPGAESGYGRETAVSPTISPVQQQRRRQAAAQRHRRRIGRSAQQLRTNHQLQQLLRIHHRQRRRRQIGRRLSPPPPGKSKWAGWSKIQQTFDIEDLRAFDQEERIYRLRCVEAWSMVIPWMGFPLSKLLEAVEPTADAKYVRFETILRSRKYARPEKPLVRVALRRRAAPG